MNWIVHIYNLWSLIWWWVSFGRLAAAPDHTANPMLFGWLIPNTMEIWSSCQIPSVLCALPLSPHGIRVTEGIVYNIAALQ